MYKYLYLVFTALAFLFTFVTAQADECTASPTINNPIIYTGDKCGFGVISIHVPEDAKSVVIEAVGGGGGGVDGTFRVPGAGGHGCKEVQKPYRVSAGDTITIKIGKGGQHYSTAYQIDLSDGEPTKVKLSSSNDNLIAPGCYSGAKTSRPLIEYKGGYGGSCPVTGSCNPGAKNGEDSIGYEGSPGFKGGIGGMAGGGAASDFGDGAQGGRRSSHDLNKYPAILAGPGAGGGGGLGWNPASDLPGTMDGGDGGAGAARLTFHSTEKSKN